MQNHANNSTSIISNKSKTTNCHKFKIILKGKSGEQVRYNFHKNTKRALPKNWKLQICLH